MQMHIYDRYKLTRERIVKLQKANNALKKNNGALDKANKELERKNLALEEELKASREENDRFCDELEKAKAAIVEQE